MIIEYLLNFDQLISYRSGEMILFLFPQHKHWMFGACVSCCTKKTKLKHAQVGMEPRTFWLLDRGHTTNPPRMPDGCSWFDFTQ